MSDLDGPGAGNERLMIIMSCFVFYLLLFMVVSSASGFLCMHFIFFHEAGDTDFILHLRCTNMRVPTIMTKLGSRRDSFAK